MIAWLLLHFDDVVVDHTLLIQFVIFDYKWDCYNYYISLNPYNSNKICPEIYHHLSWNLTNNSITDISRVEWLCCSDGGNEYDRQENMSKWKILSGTARSHAAGWKLRAKFPTAFVTWKVCFRASHSLPNTAVNTYFEL